MTDLRDAGCLRVPDSAHACTCWCLQAYLNGIDVPGIFFARTLLAKLLGSVGVVAGGLSVGKEGPFVHAGACIAALLSQVRMQQGGVGPMMHVRHVLPPWLGTFIKAQFLHFCPCFNRPP